MRVLLPAALKGRHATHQPCGPIYWAGSERATPMHGFMEGAVRSGELAADDVMSKLG